MTCPTKERFFSVVYKFLTAIFRSHNTNMLFTHRVAFINNAVELQIDFFFCTEIEMLMVNHKSGPACMSVVAPGMEKGA